MSKLSSAQKWQLIAISAAVASFSTFTGAEAQGSHRTFNVKSFGAAGDGTTDDTAAIQSALTAAANTGAQVVFPSGTYLISAALTGTGLAVVGSNATLTTSTAGISMLVLQGTSPSCTGMSFNASGASNVFALVMTNATGANSTSNNFGSALSGGIIYQAVTGGTVTSNTMPSFTGIVGIELTSARGVTVTKNVVSESTSVTTSGGIAEFSGVNNLIQGNAVTWGTNSANTAGIVSEGSTQSQIIKNTVNGGAFGIGLSMDSSSTVDHNVISNSSDAGIIDRTGTTDVISNNAISNVTNDAIRTNGATGGTITTNSIDGAGANGIQAFNGGNVVITNNAIGNCALTTTINAIIRVNQTSATSITVTGNQYKGNTANVTDFIHVIQTVATVSGNKTNSLLPTVVGP